jgi:hypothetical protein
MTPIVNYIMDNTETSLAQLKINKKSDELSSLFSFLKALSFGGLGEVTRS